MREHLIDSNDVRIKIYEYSQTGEALLLLHYMGGSSAIWRNIIPRFMGKYCVIVIEIRGTGYQLETLAEDVQVVLNSLEIDKAYIGTRFASIYPERALSLVNSEAALVNKSEGLHTGTKEVYINKYFSSPEQKFESREAVIQHMKERQLPWSKERELVVKDYEPRKLENRKVTFISKRDTLCHIAEDLCDRRVEYLYENIQCSVLFLPAEKEGDLNKKLEFIKSVKLKLKK